jgi:hypothetical protein
MSQTSLDDDSEKQTEVHIGKPKTSGPDIGAIEEQSPVVKEDKVPEKAVDAPDGGLTAWLVVLGAFCCGFSGPGWLNSKCSPTLRVTPRLLLADHGIPLRCREFPTILRSRTPQGLLEQYHCLDPFTTIVLPVLPCTSSRGAIRQVRTETIDYCGKSHSGFWDDDGVVGYGVLPVPTIAGYLCIDREWVFVHARYVVGALPCSIFSRADSRVMKHLPALLHGFPNDG